jgi:hypothetical protein
MTLVMLHYHRSGFRDLVLDICPVCLPRAENCSLAEALNGFAAVE